jgi:hypothetical protein
MTCRECGAESFDDLCGIHRPFNVSDDTEDLICLGELIWNEVQDGVLQTSAAATVEPGRAA